MQFLWNGKDHFESTCQKNQHETAKQFNLLSPVLPRCAFPSYRFLFFFKFRQEWGSSKVFKFWEVLSTMYYWLGTPYIHWNLSQIIMEWVFIHTRYTSSIYQACNGFILGRDTNRLVTVARNSNGSTALLPLVNIYASTLFLSLHSTTLAATGSTPLPHTVKQSFKLVSDLI